MKEAAEFVPRKWVRDEYEPEVISGSFHRSPFYDPDIDFSLNDLLEDSLNEDRY